MNNTADLSNEEYCTSKWEPLEFNIWTLVLLVGPLSLLTFLTVAGNTLVVAAVATNRQLRTANGMLIQSLAVADLLVGLFVLPFSVVHEALHGYWIFGHIWCEIWLAIDVWMCTSSIYNLVTISLDRYLAITKPLKYPVLVNKCRTRLTIAATWTLSFLICLPPMIVTWPAVLFTDAVEHTCSCSPIHNSDLYIIYSACGSFFIPMTLIIIVYSQIYMAVRRATYTMSRGRLKCGKGSDLESSELRVHRGTPSSTKKSYGSEIHTELNKGSDIRIHRMPPSSRRSSDIRIHQVVSPSRRRSNFSENITASNETANLRINRITSSSSRSRRSEFSDTHTDSNELPTVQLWGPTPDSSRCPSIQFTIEEATSVGHNFSSDSHFSDFNKTAVNSYQLHVPKVMLSCYSERNIKDLDETRLNMNCCRIDPTLSLTSMKSLKVPTFSSNQSPTEVIEVCHDSNEEGAKVIPLAATRKLSNSLPSLVDRRQWDRPHNAGSQFLASVRSINRSTSSLSRQVQEVYKRAFGGLNSKKGYQQRLSVEIRAAKTVAIVTGCFIFCWLGFALVYTLRTVDVNISPTLWSVFFWLGYCNSALNPVIYTVFNREYRHTFRRLLTRCIFVRL